MRKRTESDGYRWITSYGGHKPSIDPSAFVDVSARIIGRVTVEAYASIWPMAVLRADSAAIRVGRSSAVLDLALLEAPSGHPVILDEEVLVSHGAIIHGAQLHSRVLVGIGAIVLDGAVISEGSIIGAGSLVPPGMMVPPNTLLLGSPARVMRETTSEERDSIALQLQELLEKSKHLRSQVSGSSAKIRKQPQ